MRPVQQYAMWLLVGLTMSSVLAGCVDTNDDRAANGARIGSDDDPGRYVPWTLSEYWTWDMEIRGFDRFDTVKLVYYDKVGPEYLVGTPSEDEALYHAVFSVNPILGRVHEDLLSPHEKGLHAAMFPFEGRDSSIRDGDTWSTRFYETLLQFEATYSDAVPTPTGPRPGFLIRGENPEGGLTVEHNYVAESKWFTHLKVTDRAGVRFELALVDHGTGYSGPAHFIRATDLFHDTMTSQGALLSASSGFDVTTAQVADDRVEGFAISTDIETGFGDATLQIIDPDGEVIYQRSYSQGDDVAGEFNIEVVYPEDGKSSKPLGERPNFAAGRYELRLDFASRDAQAEVHIVGIQDHSGRV